MVSYPAASVTAVLGENSNEEGAMMVAYAHLWSSVRGWLAFGVFIVGRWGASQRPYDAVVVMHLVYFGTRCRFPELFSSS
jgi:hypothetical protein